MFFKNCKDCFEFVEVGAVILNEISVFPTVGQQITHHAHEEIEVGGGLNEDMFVRLLSRLAPSGIDHHQLCAVFARLLDLLPAIGQGLDLAEVAHHGVGAQHQNVFGFRIVRLAHGEATSNHLIVGVKPAHAING